MATGMDIKPLVLPDDLWPGFKLPRADADRRVITAPVQDSGMNGRVHPSRNSIKPFIAATADGQDR